VLVISASMGAGHDGAAHELVARLGAVGTHAEVRDFLESGPLRLGTALRTGYELELRYAPSLYEATYRLWYRVPWLTPVVAWLVTALTGRRVLRWVRQSGATVVVSTYPLATLCLGRLRATDRLPIPTVNFITDFGVHPLWVHSGIDLNLAIHDRPAEMAATRTGRPSIACGPVVAGAFEPQRLPDRAQTRAALGVTGDERAVLVVAGSWGVGGLAATWQALAEDDRFVPIVVCGRDARLRQEVSALAGRAAGKSVVLGWTEDMAGLMAGCDALVENAGGLTSLEALRAGLPVVTFRPIAGHGRENAAHMAAAGVSCLAADPEELVEALARLTSSGPARSAQIEAGSALFRSRADTLILELAAS
jgi:UDP-N-acetylglucosamine:LPS N-acetylglucosamine transferase